LPLCFIVVSDLVLSGGLNKKASRLEKQPPLGGFMSAPSGNRS